MSGLPLLSLVIFAPWAGRAPGLPPGLGAPAACRALALGFSLSTLVLAAVASSSFDRS